MAGKVRLTEARRNILGAMNAGWSLSFRYGGRPWRATHKDGRVQTVKSADAMWLRSNGMICPDAIDTSDDVEQWMLTDYGRALLSSGKTGE